MGKYKKLYFGPLKTVLQITLANDHPVAIASSSILGLKITILSKNSIFRHKTELEAIARWSVDTSREVDCSYFGNIGRNSGYFLLPFFLGSYLTLHSLPSIQRYTWIVILSLNLSYPFSQNLF